jgi:hypothetical protein
MKTKKIPIHLCPNCKEYLAKTDIYRHCMYCGWKYKKSKLLKRKIEVFDGFVDGEAYRKRRAK